MTAPAPYRLIGSNPSPYSVKMRAILRYRRLPFFWEPRSPDNMAETKDLKPQVIPIMQYPDGSFRNDSTFLALDLEERHRERSIVPEDPVLAFLSCLIEDMADEWGTKFMFHYRWFYEADQRFCSEWIARESGRGLPDQEIMARAAAFRDRQVGRMALVGCTPENRPAIEASFTRLLSILDDGLRHAPFLFGGRPVLADFGWFGQLFQLFMDPTPSALMRQAAPRVYMWVPRMDDASGIEGDLVDPAAPLPRVVRELLRLAGDTYLPFLAANARAIEEGRETFSLTVEGHPYAQGTFRYQAKCRDWLRGQYAALAGEAKARADAVLAETGCLAHLR